MLKSDRELLNKLSKQDRELLTQMEREQAKLIRKRLFWSAVHNTRDLIVFLVTLPALPIIYIIKAVKGEL
jgi:hypothetical protein